MTRRAPKIVVMGSANMDLVLPVARLPRAGETVLGGDLALYPGGKGANQACAAARLGGKVSMIALVGQDEFGARLVASLKSAGVDTSRVGFAARPTGCALIHVLPSGENSIVISPGANTELDSETALGQLEVLGSGDCLLGQLETPIETVESVFRAAKAAGALSILDPAPARALPEKLLCAVDFLTPNQTEAATILGAPGLEISSYEEAAGAARRLLSLGPGGVVLKLGSLGCFVHSDSFSGAVAAFPVTAVDSTAAGDVFNAGFAVALTEGRPVAQAARFANAAAAISVTRHGAQNSIPSREEVEAFLSASGPAR